MHEKMKRLLHIEDEALIALTVKLELEFYGYFVHHVNSGEKALDALVNEGLRFDLVLIDIDLGSGMDGPSTAEEILKHIDIPIVFLSSHTEREVVAKTERITSYGYVVKHSGTVVLDASIKMALKLYNANCARRAVEASIVYRKRIYELLVDLASNHFIAPSNNANEKINQCLKVLGEFVVADRVYIFSYDWNKQVCDNTFTWCCNGVEPQMEFLQQIPLDGFGSWVEAHQKGETYYIADVLKLDEDDGSRQVLEPQGIRSIMAAPIEHGDKCIGFIGFDYVDRLHTYCEAEEKLLQTFARMLVNLSIRNEYEEKIRNQLSEKSILLTEVHHRIKNNLGSIEGLLVAQYRANDNDSVKAALMEAISRVQSARVLYGKLLLTEGYAEVPIKSYVDGLIDAVINTCTHDGIIVERQISEFNLSTKRAMYLGIAINELLTNVFKYAFERHQQGTVSIVVSLTMNRVSMSIHDNGVGIDEHEIATRPAGFGLTIVKMLVEQLQGSLSITNQVGTKTEIQFELNEAKAF